MTLSHVDLGLVCAPVRHSSHARCLSPSPLLSLAGCSLVGDSDPFGDAYLSVYDVSLDWVEGTEPATGRLGLTFIFNDGIDPTSPCTGQGGYSGRWELDDPKGRFPEGSGSVRGSLGCDGIQLYLFDGDIRGDDNDRGVLYVLTGEITDDRRIEGTWDRVGAYPEGALRGQLVREATAFVQVP